MNAVKQFINLELIVDVKNYKQSFDKWMKIRMRHNPTSEQNKKQLFNKYLRVIKPVIHRFVSVTKKYKSSQYGFYSSTLNKAQIQMLKNVFDPLKDYEITADSPKILLENQKVEESLQKNFKEIYRLDVESKPINQQLKWWGQTIEVEPIKIEGVVVTGKGEGKKNLGMPTANLQLSPELQKKLDNYPNGVYLVDFDFVNGQSFQGAGCLGTNPHYQNFQETRRVQVYILHNFGDQLFYGSKVVVTLKKLIRFQGKFYSFDAFLNAMHNDIQVARSFIVKKE